MKKQLLVIHGAMAFSKYASFLKYLETCPIDDPLLPRQKRWKSTLAENLGDDFDVYQPAMPNSQNAHYAEWKIWFERHFEFLHDGVILLGHSQGGYFLAKYLCEHVMPVKVKALYLLAAPFGPDDLQASEEMLEDGGDFNFDEKKLPHMLKSVENIYILHSKDDPVVPYGHALKFKEALPDAKLVTFEDREHFSMEAFPELIKMLTADS